MAKENLTHSEQYVKKTNRIILTIGIISLTVFIFGIFLLIKSNRPVDEYVEPVFNDNAADLNVDSSLPLSQNIEFSTMEGEIPLTTTPNPVPMGEVVLGTDARNVLTLGTNGKVSVKIVSVELAEPPADGFTFNNTCKDLVLSGNQTCNITMNWAPVIAGNVQNNFIISWYETSLGQANVKSAKVPVTGSAVVKEDCTICEDTGAPTISKDGKPIRNAIGPDGKIIGVIDEDGFVRDFNGNLIGKVDSDGFIVDDKGNVLGVADNRRAVYDSYGNVIGHVRPDNSVVNVDGDVIGRVLPDGSVVDLSGNIIGKAVDTGFVYDNNGNIIGRVLPDGTVVDKDSNIIGRVRPDGSVEGVDGNIIGRVSKAGKVAVDKDGNVIGVVMPDGSVVDKEGNLVGRIDDNGNVIRIDNPQGKVGKNKYRLAEDKNGNVIGYIDDNGNVRDSKGNIIGKARADGTIVDNKGNVIGKAGEEKSLILGDKGEIIATVDEQPIFSKLGDKLRLAYDKDGNVIGYIDKDGNVRDFNGNIIGKMLEDGTLVDLDGNVIGKAGEMAQLLLDKDGNVVGYIDKDGNFILKNGDKIAELGKKVRLAFDKDGNVIGYVDDDGKVYSFNKSLIGFADKDGVIKFMSVENGDVKKDGTLVYLEFEVLKGASGKNEIKVNVPEKSVANYNEQFVNIASQNGYVEIK